MYKKQLFCHFCIKKYHAISFWTWKRCKGIWFILFGLIRIHPRFWLRLRFYHCQKMQNMNKMWRKILPRFRNVTFHSKGPSRKDVRGQGGGGGQPKVDELGQGEGGGSGQSGRPFYLMWQGWTINLSNWCPPGENILLTAVSKKSIVSLLKET